MAISRHRAFLMLAVGIIILAATAYVGWRLRYCREPDMNLVLEVNNRGVGQMEQFEYSKAEREFEIVASMAPDWLPGQINLAIAMYNQSQRPEKIPPAIQILERVL